MKKISILGLHLNYGGVEQAIINQANCLCDKYEVELAITYKLLSKPAFTLSPKVKIKYLTNVKPNREVFKKYLKEKHYILAFKEGLKSLKVLYLKSKTMKDYIKSCNSDIIISSRVDFTKLLNKYARPNTITIAEEHAHHNNNSKYINKVIKSCTHINYLIPVSEELTNFYKSKCPNTKCLYIPNCLDYWPTKDSNLKSKNIISIGRLSKEKGYLDLIDVFKLIYEKDNTYHLNIVGDGNEYDNILSKIKEYHLESNISLLGFKSKDEIHKLFEDTSLYLMASYEESFGLVLIEAGSFGIPAIAFSSAQGAHEIIKDNISGYLITNRNKEEMASKSIKLLSDSKKLKEMGQEAKKISERYKFENIKNEWLEFIDEVIKDA